MKRSVRILILGSAAVLTAACAEKITSSFDQSVLDAAFLSTHSASRTPRAASRRRAAWKAMRSCRAVMAVSAEGICSAAVTTSWAAVSARTTSAVSRAVVHGRRGRWNA